jgi:short-subunit dehydrogenase
MYQGRWALVTGASSGLGRHFALALAARGADVAITARREDRLAALATEIEGLGRRAVTIAADLYDPATPRSILDQMTARAGPVDILVNNAGFGMPGTFRTTLWDEQADFLQLMLTSYTELAHRTAGPMAERGWGRIVNVASLAGLVPGSAGHTLYAPVKSYLIVMSQALAAELESAGVHVTATCPGFTLTEFHDVNRTRDRISALPGFMVMRAEPVVEGSLRALETKKTVYVPGAWNKFVATLARTLPMSIGERLVRRQARRYRSQEPVSPTGSESSG